mmetsp:Transcript_42512/g.76152  ORF Transcript_42512/g.76152 Transcript_42512/m.76152 type:complete len:222 (+) Transcript_42512:127-792(+)
MKRAVPRSLHVGADAAHDRGSWSIVLHWCSYTIVAPCSTIKISATSMSSRVSCMCSGSKPRGSVTGRWHCPCQLLTQGEGQSCEFSAALLQTTASSSCMFGGFTRLVSSLQMPDCRTHGALHIAGSPCSYSARQIAPLITNCVNWRITGFVISIRKKVEGFISQKALLRPPDSHLQSGFASQNCSPSSLHLSWRMTALTSGCSRFHRPTKLITSFSSSIPH